MAARAAGRASCRCTPATGKGGRDYTPTSTVQNVIFPKPQQRPRSARAKPAKSVEAATATDLLLSPPPPTRYRGVEVDQDGPSAPEDPSACCGAAHTPEPRTPSVMPCQRKPSANPSSVGRPVGGPPSSLCSGVGPPSRHAQDDMVVPTLRRSGGGGPPSNSRACGVVPVGRDSPIGLDLRRFLSAPDPFGQVGGGRQPSLTAEQTFAALREPSDQMQQACLETQRACGAVGRWAWAASPPRASRPHPASGAPATNSANLQPPRRLSPLASPHSPLPRPLLFPHLPHRSSRAALRTCVWWRRCGRRAARRAPWSMSST